MADIYRARDKDTGEIYALKVLFPRSGKKSEKLSGLFNEPRVENDVALFFNHPNVVQVYKTGRDKGKYYIVMELIEGCDLHTLLDREEPLSYLEKLEIALQTAKGIEYLHKRGVIHKDSGPKNIMVTPEKRVKLIDFGIAMLVGSKMNKEAEIRAGTPGYMSPEQIRSMAVDFRADIYNLGVTFYRLFSGEMPFGGVDSKDRMIHHLNEEPPDIMEKCPDIDPRLAQLIMKSIRRRAEERFQDMSSVRKILFELVQERKMPELSSST